MVHKRKIWKLRFNFLQIRSLEKTDLREFQEFDRKEMICV